jgi:hypothetical protein
MKRRSPESVDNVASISEKTPVWLVSLVVIISAFVAPSNAAAQNTAGRAQSSEGFNNYVTAYYNLNFGGTLFENREGTATTGFGAAIAFQGRRVVSGELDVNYSPQFFGPEDRWSRNSVLTVTFSGIVGPWIRIGGTRRVRPYALVGGGLIRSTIITSVESSPLTNPVLDVGGGLLWSVSPRVGIRGDLRYRWDRGDLAQRGGYIATLNYVRSSLGMTLAF